MKKKKYLKIVLYIILLIVTVFYTYKFRFIVDDELFNYGFAKNVLDGLIPYKDFNMIIPPLFTYVTALFLKIFGQKLIIYHILISIIIGLITYLSSKKIGKLSIVIYLLLLIYPYTGYNMFVLLLLFILLNLNKDNKNNIYLEPIIISLMILTKHTLGLLIIPSLIYSKKKLKTFLIYVVSFLILLLYLFINNSIFDFFNYTILGIFDFANKNNTGLNFLTIIEILIIITLIYNLIKTKKKEYAYVLLFQVVTLPIINYVHFIISFIPFIYLMILKYYKNFYFSWFILVITLSIFLGFNALVIKERTTYNYISYPENNFMKGRTVQNVTSSYNELVKEKIDEYKDYKLYIFSNLAYQIKLNLDYKINKYDLINNGNMGYNGSKNYIKEIDKYCKKNKCIFFVNDFELNNIENFQTNKDILMYITNNYKKVHSSNLFNIHTN